jgi:putative hydrolase of the HAD superfamily
VAISRICVVVFDAVGTLITPDPPASVAYFLAGKRYGSRRTEPEIARRFRASLASPRAEDAEAYRTSEKDERRFWKDVVHRVLDDLAEPARDACFEELFAHFAQPQAWRVYPDVAPALRELARREVSFAVASNFDARLHSVWAGHRDLSVIDRRFVSSEIGWRKPDRRFFAAVCDALGTEPGEMLYVGDEPESDIAAAKAAGWKAVLARAGCSVGAAALESLTDLGPWLDRTVYAAGSSR